MTFWYGCGLLVPLRCFFQDAIETTALPFIYTGMTSSDCTGSVLPWNHMGSLGSIYMYNTNAFLQPQPKLKTRLREDRQDGITGLEDSILSMVTSVTSHVKHWCFFFMLDCTLYTVLWPLHILLKAYLTKGSYVNYLKIATVFFTFLLVNYGTNWPV